MTAATSWSNTSRMVTTPGTATSTRGLSPGVWNTLGRPISTTTLATASGIEDRAKAQGVAIQAISSVVNRSTEARRLSGAVCVVTAERSHGEPKTS